MVAYASRTLSKAERRYCVTRRELLAIVTFMKHFRPYLLGHTFSIRTDHGSLTWLHSFKELEGQLARWIPCLQEYNFSILHRLGRSRGNTDALSRLPDPNNTPGSCDASLPSQQHSSLQKSTHASGHVRSDVNALAAATINLLTTISRDTQMQDDAIGPILSAVQAQKKINPDTLKDMSHDSQLLHHQWDLLTVRHRKLWRKYTNFDGTVNTLQLIVPHSARQKILAELQDSSVSGHLGEDKMLSRLKQRFYWPGCSADVRQWCATCGVCAARKTTAPHRCAPLHTIQAGYPMQTVAVNIVGPFPTSPAGTNYILVAMDYFTRWAEAYPIPNQEASTVATKLVNEMFLRFSPPQQLHSDQGRQFESKLLAEICNCLGIQKMRTTLYHPECDGLVERFNRTLLNMLATTTATHPSTWEDHIQKVLMAYNSSVQPTTGYTPFFLMFAREAHLPVDLMYGSSPHTRNTYASQLAVSLREAYAHARNNMHTAHRCQKQYYNEHVHGKPYQPGDLVWLHTPMQS